MNEIKNDQKTNSFNVMKKFGFLILIICFIISGCNSYKYIHDAESVKRQKEIVSNRSANLGCDVIGCFGSALFSAVFNTEMNFEPSEREFKHVKIVNGSTDTMFINMLTDATWGEGEYCDFYDVHVPTEKAWRVLLPIGINYNLYYGVTDNPEEDILLEINTAKRKKIILIPGIKTDTLNNFEIPLPNN